MEPISASSFIYAASSISFSSLARPVWLLGPCDSPRDWVSNVNMLPVFWISCKSTSTIFAAVRAYLTLSARICILLAISCALSSLIVLSKLSLVTSPLALV